MGQSLGCPSCPKWEQKDRMDMLDLSVLVIQRDNS